MRQCSSTNRYRNRSWRRLGRPCQNSHSVGASRQPPQCAGRGTARPAKRFSNSTTRPINSWRSLITSDWGDAQAPTWLGRGPRSEVLVALAIAHSGDVAPNPHLPVQVEPGEGGSSDGSSAELVALDRFVVGEEGETESIGIANQHCPGVRPARQIDGGQDHCVGFGDARLECCRVPHMPLLHRVERQIGQLEAGGLVLHPADRGYEIDRRRNPWVNSR